MTEEVVTMYELLDALEQVITATDPAKRRTLADTINAYAKDYPDDFFWATGAQSPTLLSNLMMIIDTASQPEAESKARAASRLLDRKPAGSA